MPKTKVAWGLRRHGPHILGSARKYPLGPWLSNEDLASPTSAKARFLGPWNWSCHCGRGIRMQLFKTISQVGPNRALWRTQQVLAAVVQRRYLRSTSSSWQSAAIFQTNWQSGTTHRTLDSSGICRIFPGAANISIIQTPNCLRRRASLQACAFAELYHRILQLRKRMWIDTNCDQRVLRLSDFVRPVPSWTVYSNRNPEAKLHRRPQTAFLISLTILTSNHVPCQKFSREQNGDWGISLRIMVDLDLCAKELEGREREIKGDKHRNYDGTSSFSLNELRTPSAEAVWGKRTAGHEKKTRTKDNFANFLHFKWISVSHIWLVPR